MEINLRKYDDKVSKSKVSSFTFNNNDPIELFVKRDDLIHHEVSGNKWRKLKWNLYAAIQNNCNVISTYGGIVSYNSFI